MKKIVTCAAVAFLFSVLAASAGAQVEFEKIKSRTQEKLQVTGFFDYYPFGAYENNVYSGAFRPFIEYFANEGKYVLDFLPVTMNYEDTVREVAKKAEADILLGMYSETSLYADMKFIYPAAIDNPIHLVMLPSSMGRVRSTADLQNLKGAVHAKERFSDYVKAQLDKLKLERIDDSYELYGKLIRGEIDYVLTSIYFGTIETAKLGLRHQVAFSKQSLWTMPVFIGISKSSFHREYLSHTLSQMLSKPEIRAKIKQDMTDIVNKVIEKSAGTVPPTYLSPATRKETAAPRQTAPTSGSQTTVSGS